MTSVNETTQAGEDRLQASLHDETGDDAKEGNQDFGQSSQLADESKNGNEVLVPSSNGGARLKRRRDESDGDPINSLQNQPAKRVHSAPRVLDPARCIRIKKLLVVVGQNSISSGDCSNLDNQLLGLSKAFKNDVSDSLYREVLRDALVECACSFGWKASVYATLVAVLDSPQLEREVLDSCIKKLNASLAGSGQFELQGQVILRFLSQLCFTKVLEWKGFAALLVRLIEIGRHLDIIRTIPWILHDVELEDHKDCLSTVLDSINRLFERSDPMVCDLHSCLLPPIDNVCFQFEEARAWHIVQCFRGATGQKGTDSKVVAADAGYTVDDLEDASEAEKLLICKPYKSDSVAELLKKRTCTALPFDCSCICEPSGSFSIVSLSSERINLFASAGKQFVEDNEKVLTEESKLHAYEISMGSELRTAYDAVRPHSRVKRWLLSLFVQEVMQAYVLFTPQVLEILKTFADVSSGHFIFECVLGECNRGTSNIAFTQRVLEGLSNELKDGFNICGDAFNAVMLLSPKLNHSLLDAIANYMAFHLACSTGGWHWEKWSEVAALDTQNSRRRFLEQILERFVWLRSRADVLRCLPAAWEGMFACLQNPRPSSSFVSEDGSASTSVNGVEITTPIFELSDILQRNVSESIVARRIAEETQPMSHLMKLEYILHATLFAGLRSLTDMALCMNLTKEIIAQLIADEGDKEMASNFVLDKILAFWRSNWEWTMYVVQRYVHLGVLDAATVAKYFCIHNPENLGNWQVFVLIERLLDFPSRLPVIGDIVGQKANHFGTFGEAPEKHSSLGVSKVNGEKNEVVQLRAIVAVLEQGKKDTQLTSAQERLSFLLDRAAGIESTRLSGAKTTPSV